MAEPVIADFSKSELSKEDLLAAIAALSLDTTDLIMDRNKLETMPCLRHLPNLTIVCCQENRIKSLGDLSYLKNLIHLVIYKNPIGFINVANLPVSLEEIYFSANWSTNIGGFAKGIKKVSVMAYREIDIDFSYNFPNATVKIITTY